MTGLSGLKMLGADDIVTGQTYLFVLVTLKGELLLVRLKALSDPDLEGWFRSMQWVLLPEEEGLEEGAVVLEEEQTNLFAIGCAREQYDSALDTDRTFADTHENLVVLSELVNSKDTVAWLTFLGVADPPAALEAMKRESEEIYERYCDEPLGLVPEWRTFH